MAAALLVLALLFSTVSADPPQTWKPTDWGPYYYPSIPCPAHPSALCDFYVDGYQNSVPTFYLDDGVAGDHALVPVRRSVLNVIGSLDHFAPGVKSALTDTFVLANTRNATLLSYPGGSYDADVALATFDQFYLNAGTDSVSHLFTRTLQKHNDPERGEHDMAFWQNKCVWVPFSGVFIPSVQVNLNFNDTHTEYKRERRCIVFKTA